MTTDARKKIAVRVAKSAGEAVTLKGYATAIDVFLGLEWLSQENLNAWKRGQVAYLEQVVTANLSKISDAMHDFRAWAAHSKLKPSLTVYKHKSKNLRFSKYNNQNIEKAYCTHYVLQRKEVNIEVVDCDVKKNQS